MVNPVYIQPMRISQWPKSADTHAYLGVRCQKCRTPILFALDRTSGEGRPEPPAKLFLTCPKESCRHQADYSGATVSRFKRQAEAAAAETKKPARAKKR